MIVIFNGGIKIRPKLRPNVWQNTVERDLLNCQKTSSQRHPMANADTTITHQTELIFSLFDRYGSKIDEQSTASAKRPTPIIPVQMWWTTICKPFSASTHLTQRSLITNECNTAVLLLLQNFRFSQVSFWLWHKQSKKTKHNIRHQELLSQIERLNWLTFM